MEALLDSNKFDIGLLQHTVSVCLASNSSPVDRATANQVLTQLKEHPTFYQKVPGIVESGCHEHTKVYAVQALQEAIKFRWKAMDEGTQVSIQQYIMGAIEKYTVSPEEMEVHNNILGKFNSALIAIVKHTWPEVWPNFMQVLCTAARTSEPMCINSLKILTLLSEEIFEFGEEITSSKSHVLRGVFNAEVTQVMELCQFVIDNSNEPKLLRAQLKCLAEFISWMPAGFIYNNELINSLVQRFLPNPLYRNDALVCITKIVSLDNTPEEAKGGFIEMYSSIIDVLVMVMPPNTPLAKVYQTLEDNDQDFVQRLSVFLTKFYSLYIQNLEGMKPEKLLTGLGYVVMISSIGAIEEMQLFKICLDFWHDLSFAIYKDKCLFNQQYPVANNLMFGMETPTQSPRCNLYVPIFKEVRKIIIGNMVKPEEVLIEEDDSGEIVRAAATNTDSIALYKIMRETLIYLTQLDQENTENIMQQLLTVQVERELVWHELNTLCWAVGALSGTLTEEYEKRFLVTIIKDLLYLCEKKTGKQNKAVVASNIMYVVGQYPTFLRQHWKFLKTVVNKCFEFMHELHPGVQDMACETFIKIAKACKPKFVITNAGETGPFIDELLENLPATISDLKPHQVHTFFQAVGYMITAGKDEPSRTNLLLRLMAVPNNSWMEIMSAASPNPDILFNSECLKEMHKILRTNLYVCQAVGPCFVPQISRIYESLMLVYRAFSGFITAAVARDGERATNLSVVRQIQGVKKEFLKLIEEFVSSTDNPLMIATDFMPNFIEPVLLDYKNSPPSIRLPELLACFTVIINALKGDAGRFILPVLEATFEVTMSMINGDYTSHQDLRLNFFQLIKAMVDNCFPALFEGVPEVAQTWVIDSIIHAINHTERNISETGMEIVNSTVEQVSRVGGAFAEHFYKLYYIKLLNCALWVLTDRLHKSGFKHQAQLLKHLFHIIVTNQISTPLWDESDGSIPRGITNAQYLSMYVSNLLRSNFPHLASSVSTTFVEKLSVLPDISQFKSALRDFLIQLKEFAAENNDELFAAENL